MTRKQLIEKKRRILRAGRAWESEWIRAGRPHGLRQTFREAATDALATFGRVYRDTGRANAQTALAAFKESYKSQTAR